MLQRDTERIVITGIGVVAPNANGKAEFLEALRQGKSGINFSPELESYNFRCQLSGKPTISEAQRTDFQQRHGLFKLKSSGILYGLMAADQAWHDAGLRINSNCRDTDTGVVFGTGSNGIEATRYGMRVLDGVGIHRADGTNILQALNNGISAYIGYLFNLGNQITTNASACNTGTEGILMAADRIRAGLAKRMLVGSSESDSPYVYGPFDAMFATAQGVNDRPQAASGPMSRDACGFVPSAGAGALILESLASAAERGARIYAELLGGQINSGGQRGDGSMTLGNTAGMIRCIRDSLIASGIQPREIDLISGHLSSTIGDVREVKSWKEALGLPRKCFPYINSTKSMIGHCLSASGSIEVVSSVLQLDDGFIHPSLNASPLHPEILDLIPERCVPYTTVDRGIQIVAKISLGFGDVNSCLVLKKWEQK